MELAGDGQEGIEKALQGHFDVIPYGSTNATPGGVEATRKLREQVIRARSLRSPRTRCKRIGKRCLNVGCTDYLTKPIQRNHLVRVIEKLASSAESPQAKNTCLIPHPSSDTEHLEPIIYLI